MQSVIEQTAADARAAAQRIEKYVRQTPLDYSPRFSALSGANVYFKLENLQYTGSFKLRGAFNRLLTLSDAQRAAGCVTASSGNHGAAVAFAMQALGVKGKVFVPEETSSVKVDAMRAYGGDVQFFGQDGLDTELHARAWAAEHGMQYLSPYNDRAVIAGQGSCGVEIAAQLPEVDALFVAVGGGGLISGVGSVLRECRPGVSLVACQPKNSAVMTKSVQAGKILQLPSVPTLSDGTAGGIEEGAITFDLCRALVDQYRVISEARIGAAMRLYMDAEHQLLEGAAGVAVAGLLEEPGRFAGKNVVVLVCGANISRSKLATILADPH
tara:strand:+ start:2620 stop:3597 length:978 start_codon:yes stop_codon:yes gene_type:complete